MRFDRLENKLQQRIRGEWYGNLASFFHGAGLEIDDFRLYQPGDTPRHINRKLSAKHDDLRVNQRQQDQDIPVIIVLDINANRASGRRQTNRDIVQGRLGDYILFAQDVGLQHTTVYLPDTSGATGYTCRHIEQWLHLFMLAEQAVHMSHEQQYTSCMGHVLELQQSYRQQHVLLYVSDFLGLTSHEENLLEQLDEQHIIGKIVIDVPDIVGKNFLKP